MKKSIFLLFIITTFFVQGQDSKYIRAMENNIAILDSAKDMSSFQSANNAFERIANANPKEWLPLYYQSYCLIMIGMKQSQHSKQDEYYNKAEELINRADVINSENSEIYALKAWLTGMKISVDPATRGPQLGQQAGLYNQKAVDLNKENPRGYLMKGTGLMYTPPQYGGGKAAAMPVLEMAVEKFKTFKPSSSIMPHW